MTRQEIYALIKEAIITGTQITIEYKYGIGDDIIPQTIHPYILGSDFYQYDFVWGFFPYRMIYYKYLVENIKSAKLTDITYTVLQDAVYHYAIEEEHYAVLLGFDKIYVGQAIPTEGGQRLFGPSTS